MKKKPIRKIFYNYGIVFKHLFKFEADIEKMDDWKTFRKQWDTNDRTMVILPLGVFDLTGLDIRYVFREYGRNDAVRFLLIGTTKQIEFALSQNEKFLCHIIDHVTLPLDFSVLEAACLKKIETLEKQTKGK